jgi:enoyl-CoA hydratase/carnithine racemase
MTAFTCLQLSQSQGIATVTLNLPDKRNALSLAMMQELTQAFALIAVSDARGVILAANGPVFSAGHNFADMAGADEAHLQQLFAACTDMMNSIQNMPQPVLARVHALATAAGCQLVATCDLVIASEQAAFALPGGKGNLFCHTPLVAVSRSIGRKRALELALTGDPINAQTAADWGLVNRVVPHDQLDAACLDLIQRATRGSAASKASGKQGFYEQMELPQAQAYAVSMQRMARGAHTEEAQQSFQAFLNRS